jgi:SAM-dependent methyltransferase
MTTDRHERPHSAEFFGPERDYWWSRDQLELIAGRLELSAVRSVLDVGCGVGYWARLVASVLSPGATIIGVDREAVWVQEAAAIAQLSGGDGQFRYQQGLAEALVFPDASFDLVTCQTLLIHVPSPRAVIEEMLRVTKPGGVILLAEPNNRASLLVDTSVNAGAPIDDLLERMRFLLICERGKEAIGEGNNSIGDLLPGYLAEQGVQGVQTFICDKAGALVPPYHSDDQRALRSYAIKQAEEQTWGWSREDASRYFTAGGGTEQEFEIAWERRLNENHLAAAALTDGSFHTAGGNILYIIAGQKPGGTGG